VSDLSVLDIMFEYFKLTAFSRLYLILLKKKPSLKSLFLSSIFVTLGVPFRMLVFFFKLYKINKGFRGGLIVLYHDIFYKYKNCKIEILNSEIYINCFSLKGLFKSLMLRDPTFIGKGAAYADLKKF
jgi:hypothetical protein